MHDSFAFRITQTLGEFSKSSASLWSGIEYRGTKVFKRRLGVEIDYMDYSSSIPLVSSPRTRSIRRSKECWTTEIFHQKVKQVTGPDNRPERGLSL